MRYFNGSILQDARLDLGLTQEALGAKIGVGKSSICEWEAGKRPPPTKFLPRLADTLQITIDQLFT